MLKSCIHVLSILEWLLTYIFNLSSSHQFRLKQRQVSDQFGRGRPFDLTFMIQCTIHFLSFRTTQKL